MQSEQREADAAFVPSLGYCLRHPGKQLRAFDEGRARVPYRLWAKLTGIAVSGSLLYGASLSLLFRRWRPGRSALWLALSAGGGWCIFGPVLVWLSRKRATSCAQACLTTMAYGEVVLVSGAGANLGFRLRGGIKESFLAGWNMALVGLSNIVMAAALAGQLRVWGVPVWKTLLAWMTVLNGGGALLFTLLRRLLQGGR